MHFSPSREMWPRLGSVILVFVTLSLQSQADDGADTNEPSVPVLLIVTPFVLSAGETETITLRGRHLQSEPEVLVAGPEALIETSIVNQGTAEIPNKFDAERAGDQFLEVQVVIPTDFSGELMVSVRTTDGESTAKSVTVMPPGCLVDEQEPNDSLAQPQPLELGQTVRGTIHQNQDVDVYRVTAHEGIPLSVSTSASSRDSLCDPIVMIFDQQGQLLSVCDDLEESTDPSITILPATPGELLIAIMDAHDLGSQSHDYVLSIDEAE